MPATALLFPGQGAQRVGMAADLHERSAGVRALFEQAEAVSGLPLTRICFGGPDDELRRTDVAQPALVASELAPLVALAELLGVDSIAHVATLLDVRWAAGHSLGEYAACVAAGALSVLDGLDLAARRGRLMARAPAGAMAAVLGLDAVRLAELCLATPGMVVVANDNAPGQVVISGEPLAVAAAADAARSAGASRVIPLQVGGAFHSPLMAAAAEEFAAAVERADVRTPRFPLIGNVSAAPLESAEAIQRELAEQIARPVRWRETALAIAAAGAGRAFECGPGTVLAGLARRITPTLVVASLGSWDHVEALAAELGAA